jgi:hypothetical protein
MARRSVDQSQDTSTQTPVQTPEVESFPVPAEVTPASPVVEPEALDSEPEALDKPHVSLAAFASLSGKKPDQIRAFQHWAKKSGNKAHTVSHWNELFQIFQKRPVK